MSSLNRHLSRRRFKVPPAPGLSALRKRTIPCQNASILVARTGTRNLATSTKSSPVLGIVDTVASEFAMVKALTNASIGALVVFQNGAYGIVTEIRKNGASRVSLLNGTVVPTETAVVEQPSIQINVSPSYTGRVVNVLGEPMDGLGPIEHTDSTVGLEAVHTHSSPSITERRSPSGSIATGIKAIDAFRPVLHGQSVLVMGEQGTEKRAFLRTVLRNLAEQKNNQLLVSEHTSIDMASSLRFVYVLTGHTEREIQERLAQMRLDNVLPHTTVVAAPSSTPPANQYLAPYTGMAIANYFRDRGEHAVVFIESLSASATASRKMSGFAFSKLNIPQSNLASIFDKCGTTFAKRMNASTTGADNPVGSVTLFSTYDMPVFSPSAGYSEKDRYTRMDGNYLRSLADSVFITDAKESKNGGFFGFPYKHLVTGDGGGGIHTKQGPGLHHVASRGKLVVLEAEEAARNATESLKLGIEPTADKDTILDIHKKAKLLLYPTVPELQELQQLQAQLKENDTESVPESLGNGTMHSTSSALAGTVPKRTFRTMSNSPARTRNVPTKSSSVAVYFSSKGSDDDVVSRFSDKLSPAQIQALMAARSTRRKSAAARMASANFKPNVKSTPEQGLSSDGKETDDGGSSTSASDKKTENDKPSRKRSSGFDFSGLYGNTNNTSRKFSTLSRKNHASSNVAAGSIARSFSIFSKIKENLTSRVSVDDAPEGKLPQEDSPEEEEERETTLTSTEEEMDTVNRNTDAPRKRLAFRAPDGRIPQPQLFKTVCTVPLSQLEDMDLDELEGDIQHAQADKEDDMLNLMASLELPSSGWVAQPFSGDAQRIFLDLFVLSHAYVAPVPLARIYEYEKGLYDLLSALPSSRSLYTAIKRQQKGKNAELLSSSEEYEESSLSDGSTPLSRYFSLLKRFEDETLPYYEQEKANQPLEESWDPFSGLMTLPLSSIRTKYTDGTLLDALLTNPIPESEVNAANHDITTMVRNANNKVLQHVSLEARRERLKQKIVDAKAAIVAKQKERETKKKRWFSLSPLNPGEEDEMLNRAVQDAEDEYRASLEDADDPIFGRNAPEGLHGIGGHLRLSPSTNFHDLPPDWQVLHVVAAEYTRQFSGLPRL